VIVLISFALWIALFYFNYIFALAVLPFMVIALLRKHG
jgi:hypothetical protein